MRILNKLLARVPFTPQWRRRRALVQAATMSFYGVDPYADIFR